MGGTLAARANVLILIVLKKNFNRKGSRKFAEWDKSRIKCGMSEER